MVFVAARALEAGEDLMILVRWSSSLMWFFAAWLRSALIGDAASDPNRARFASWELASEADVTGTVSSQSSFLPSSSWLGPSPSTPSGVNQSTGTGGEEHPASCVREREKVSVVASPDGIKVRASVKR